MSSNNVVNALARLKRSIGATLVGYVHTVGGVLRTVSAKLHEHVSIEDFGAVRGTDCTTAIQACWDYCVANQRVCHIPGGLWYFDQLIWPRGLRVQGIGCLGTHQTDGRFSQTVLMQNDGIEKSGIILRDESLQGADLQMSDLLLLGPAVATTGVYHGIEFINAAGDDVAVQGQVVFERLFIRRWKGSGLKSSDTKAVFALHVNNVQSRENGRYGFELSFGIDQLNLRNILTEKNVYGGVYVGKMPANFHCSIDGWYFEGGFDDTTGFGNHPSFAFASPYALVLGGVSTTVSNTIIRICNVTAKADVGPNKRTLDAVIFQETVAGYFPANVQWDNIVVETHPTATINGNGSILYDPLSGIRIDEAVSSGHFFQDGSYIGVDYKRKRQIGVGTGYTQKYSRNGSNGLVMMLGDDGVDAGGIGVAAGKPFLASYPEDVGILMGSARVTPCSKSGASKNNLIDLGDGGNVWRRGYIGDIRQGEGVGGAASAGVGSQHIKLKIDGVVYKLLHDN